MAVVTVLVRMRQEDSEFKASLGYTFKAGDIV